MNLPSSYFLIKKSILPRWSVGEIGYSKFNSKLFNYRLNKLTVYGLIIGLPLSPLTDSSAALTITRPAVSIPETDDPGN